MTNKVNAIILAGTPTKKKKLIDEYDRQGPKNKGLVSVNPNKQPVILDILNALQNSDYINQNKIGIVGPKEKLEKIINTNIEIINQESTIFENAKKAYNAISKNGEKTLFIMCDVPFITKKPINEFILKCDDYDADFYWSLVDIKNIPFKTEQLKKSMKFHLKGKGDYRAGNMIMVKGTKMRDSELIASQIESAFEKRRTTNLLAKGELYWNLLGPYYKEFAIHACRFLTEQRVEYAVQEFANALEFIPSTLAENAGLDPIDVITELKSRHDNQEVNAGINIFNNKIEDSLEAGIIEPLKIKLQALSSATEVAIMILRIDDVLASKTSSRGPMGGGAGMNMPGMD